MTLEEKEDLRNKAFQYMKGKGWNYTEFGNFVGYSTTYISQFFNSKWEVCKPNLLNKIAACIGYRIGWQAVETAGFLTVKNVCLDSFYNQTANCISDEPGAGKSFALKAACRELPGSLYIQCEEYHKPRTFLIEVFRLLGMKPTGSTVGEMMGELCTTIERKQNALMVFDEFDKLPDQTMSIFRTLYNRLEGMAGFVLCGAPRLEQKLTKGASRDKQAYKEIYSRIGRVFIRTGRVSSTEVEQICRANGLEEYREIERIKRETVIYKHSNQESYELRQVQRMVHHYHLKQLSKPQPEETEAAA